MAFLALLEALLIALTVWGIASQIVIPTLAGVPRFPFFRRKHQQKLLADISDAEARRYELNLRAKRAKQEEELKAAEEELAIKATLEEKQ